MKIFNKEILIIVILAVLATGLSWFINWVPSFWPPQSYKCPPCYEMAIHPTVHGFPLPYWEQVAGYAVSHLPNLLLPIFFIIDILFYFILLFLGWTILKLIIKKH